MTEDPFDELVIKEARTINELIDHPRRNQFNLHIPPTGSPILRFHKSKRGRRTIVPLHHLRNPLGEGIPRRWIPHGNLETRGGGQRRAAREIRRIDRRRNHAEDQRLGKPMLSVLAFILTASSKQIIAYSLIIHNLIVF
jgi:hypothetical protein